MIKVGDYLKVNTKTLHDVFGTIIYRVEEVGLKSPEKGRENEADGVKCLMLGGSGPSARRGMIVLDSEMAISKNIEQGITEIIPEVQAKKLQDYYDDTEKKVNTGTGVVEL